MVLSTAIPTLIAATVIVIISRGIDNNPNIPSTAPAVIKLGIRAIIITFKDLKRISNIIPIAVNTTPKDLI